MTVLVMAEGQYLQLEGVCVVGAGGEVGVHQGAPTEGPAVRQLVLLPILRLHRLPVAVGGICGSHSLTAWRHHRRRRT